MCTCSIGAHLTGARGVVQARMLTQTCFSLVQSSRASVMTAPAADEDSLLFPHDFDDDTFADPLPSSSASSSSSGRINKQDDDAYWAARELRLSKAHPKKKWNQKRPTYTDGVLDVAPAVAPRRYRPKKNHKAAVFLEWMVRTFDLEKNGRGYACIECGGRSEEDAKLFSNGFHVVDVAGGRGQLAFYLAAFFTIPVSVVDPAPMNLTRFEGQYAKKQAAVKRIVNAEKEAAAAVEEEGEEAKDAMGKTESSASPTVAAIAATPLPCMVCSRITPLDSASSSSSCAHSSPAPLVGLQPVAWLSHLQHFRCMFPSSIALVQHKQHSKPPSKKEESDSEEEEEEETCDGCNDGSELSPSPLPVAATSTSAALATALESTLASCSLLYGMHSDGATEALVDYALAHGKDFAVVPCCVFPSAAPHRRVRRGSVMGKEKPTLPSRRPGLPSQAPVAPIVLDPEEMIPVRTYEQFLAYLLAKDSSIRSIDLPFDGRNTVLFRRVGGK